MPSGSDARAVTTTDCPAAGATGARERHRRWPGRRLAAKRLLASPGVPKFFGSAISPATSSQFPLKRKRIVGCPFSQRTLARMVAVLLLRAPT